MTAKEKPPGCDPRGLPDNTPPQREVIFMLSRGDDDNPVVAKLWRLHERYGYFTRAELGELAPRGHWECPGEFGPDGRWQPHCGDAA